MRNDPIKKHKTLCYRRQTVKQYVKEFSLETSHISRHTLFVFLPRLLGCEIAGECLFLVTSTSKFDWTDIIIKFH